MPYTKRQPRRDLDPDHEQLVQALVQEFKQRSLVRDAINYGQLPVIIEEQMRGSDRLRVYVIWPRWSTVREDHRSEAILDAYEREQGREVARRIVIALGLTPDEAKELGVQE